MSRGLGSQQRRLLRLLKRKSLTFKEIEAELIGPDYPEYMLTDPARRSYRRSLLGLVERQAIMTTGKGGPGDPHRYHFDPTIAAMTGDDELFKALCARIEAAEGAKKPSTARLERADRLPGGARR